MSLDDQLEVRAPATARALRLRDREGWPRVVIVGRITYSVSMAGHVELRAEGSPIRLGDEPHRREDLGLAPERAGAVAFPSPRYPGDCVAIKSGTDIMLVGRATAPERTGVTSLDVSLRVGELGKSLRVFGPRRYVARGGGVDIGPPAPLSDVPLAYEFSYGGVDAMDPERFEPRNPAGVGFAMDPMRLVGTRAPNIVDPRAGATDPAGFGPIPASWSPRREHYGTTDVAWARERAPLAPEDCDPRFSSSAPPDQQSATPLVGDEPVEVVGVRREGPWRFRLPRYGLQFRAVSDDVELRLSGQLDTFHVDADSLTVELTWRASFPAPRKLERVRQILVLGDRPLPDSLRARSNRGLPTGAAP